MADKIKVKRALLGVSDKSGSADFAARLVEQGVELVSTGGTKAHLERSGLRVIGVEEFTGFPEILDGRVKTLHPRIHGGILARRELESHRRQMAENRLEPIDLVVVNFYPFEQTVAKGGASLDHALESIDIGGPALVRAAAKNYRDVAVVVDPSDYAALVDELRSSSGALSLGTRFKLARKAFAKVAQYDAAIANYLGSVQGDAGAGTLGESFSISLGREQALRYGENPHQQAALYGNFSKIAEQLHGRDLSFNNVVDINWAINMILDFADYREAVVAILKHNTPC
ncbi:MAG TPA: bifunctional phosphoribosylaminoimidazolecarboxamide formyltransferase/IMP cyclohydrolase, partial [Candidatus Binataceae bacterium]